MATDFTNNNTTIAPSGGFQPKTKNTPLDIRTRVNLKADIDSIPNPFVGMKILVLQDETNNNEMTEYVVVSLKANNLGIADSKVNEVVLAKNFLGVSGNGMSDEQVQQLNTAYAHSQTPHVQQSDIPTKTSQLTNDSNYLTSVPSEYVTETELNSVIQDYTGGKKQVYLTQAEYDILSDIDKNDSSKVYNITDAVEQEIPTKTSQLTNDSGFITSIPSEYATETFVTNKIAEAQLGGNGSAVDLSGLGADLSLNGQTLKLKNSSGQEIGAGVTLNMNSMTDEEVTNVLTSVFGANYIPQ